MSAEPKRKRTSAERMRDHRARMRARGLKPVTIWTFDTSDPEFVRRIQEGSKRLAERAKRPAEGEIMDFIEGHMEDLLAELDADEDADR